MSIWNANQNLPGQTGDNIVIGGATYAIVTDWGSGGGTGFTGAHIQIVKTAWGDNYNTFRTSKLKPMPVQLFDGVQGTTGALIDGTNNALRITGGVNINQKLEVKGGQLDGHNKPMVSGIIQVVGPTFGKSGPTAYGPGLVNASNFAAVKVTGAVEGRSGGEPLGITFGAGNPGKGIGAGIIRRLYGGPIGYTGITGYNLIINGAGTNSSVLDRDIDTIAIQGLSGGLAVGVTAQDTNGLLTRRLYSRTGHVSLPTGVKDSIAVEGFSGMTAIEVTGGMRLSHMPSGGSFEVRSLVASRDNVAIWSADGGTAAQVKLLSGDGTPIGASAGALKVAIDNGTFTGNVTLSTNVYVRNATAGSIQVRGITGNEITVKGPLADGALEVASPSGFNIRSLTTTDKVSVGGDVATDVAALKSAMNSINTKLTNIHTDIGTLNGNIDDIETIVTNFQNNGTQTQDDGIVFNTVIKKTEQPNELISLTINTGSTPRSLSNNKEVNNGMYVQADPTNTNNIMVGGPSMVGNATIGFMLEPGENIFLQVSNLNKIYIKSLSGNQRVSCIGS